MFVKHPMKNNTPVYLETKLECFNFLMRKRGKHIYECTLAYHHNGEFTKAFGRYCLSCLLHFCTLFIFPASHKQLRWHLPNPFHKLPCSRLQLSICIEYNKRIKIFRNDWPIGMMSCTTLYGNTNPNTANMLNIDYWSKVILFYRRTFRNNLPRPIYIDGF